MGAEQKVRCPQRVSLLLCVFIFYVLFAVTTGEVLVSKILQLPRGFLISVCVQPTHAFSNHQTLMNSPTLFAGFNDLRPKLAINEQDLQQPH